MNDLQIAEKESSMSAKQKTIKCVVWDLDNTLWQGILLEDTAVFLRDKVVETIKTLDARGILHSIASKNNQETAVAKLAELGLADYFLYPQINWNPKSASIKAIANALNIGLDTFAFVDDNIFEREEVTHELPQVLCLDAGDADIENMLDMPRLKPPFITPESALRRRMYQSESQRMAAEATFTGQNEAFLATLNMTLHIRRAQEEDLQRAEELTKRTNQLNTTGYTYSYAELNALRQSDNHLLLVSSLDDKYGTYGTIGLALVTLGKTVWTLKLLLMSCRVMSRGVGTIMLNYILARAKEAGVTLQAEFVENGRNRMMYVTYKFAGFRELETRGDVNILENDLSLIQALPEYVTVIYPEAGK